MSKTTNHTHQNGAYYKKSHRHTRSKRKEQRDAKRYEGVCSQLINAAS